MHGKDYRFLLFANLLLGLVNGKIKPKKKENKSKMGQSIRR